MDRPIRIRQRPEAGSAPAPPSGLPHPPPLAVYVHLPWCLRKCPYCDFNSHEAAGGSLDIGMQQAYLRALRADLEAALPRVWGRKVQTVFFGGGTPSLFDPASIGELLTLLRTCLGLASDAEITMEANPGTFERERFAEFAAAGVSRLSLGVQSFDDDALRRIGRVHDARQAREAAQAAARLFGSFNLDLMYALPGQTLADLRSDLRAALDCAPAHLSCYHLTIEPNTLFARFPPPVPDDDAADAMQREIHETLAVAGLARYEVSAFARPGRRCRHNLNYWRFGDYLGLGAGAHGKLSCHDQIEREARYRHPRRYMEAALAGDAIEQRRVLGANDLRFEFMLNALRLTEGVPATLWTERTGLAPAALAAPLADLTARGLMEPDPTVLRATPLGMRFLNELLQAFL